MNQQFNFFARALLDYIEREGITREQMATRMGVPYDTLRKWLIGRGSTSARKMQEIADELGVEFHCKPKNT